LFIQVLDFLIITSSSGYYSFGDEGMMAKGGVFAKGGEIGTWRPNALQDGSLELTNSNIYIRDNGGDYGRGRYDVYRRGTFNRLTSLTPVYLLASIDDLDEAKKYGYNNRYAKGGITEHGLKVGDTIVSEIDENTIVVENPTSGRRTINISTGHPMAKGGMSDKIVLLVKDKKGNVVLRTTSTNKAADYCGLHGRENFTVETLDGRRIMAKGGRMGFKALSEKVASHYAGKSVPTKYQPEYGKFYDADEAKTVGNKVAAKVYRLQQGK
jgi:hypothetical protein